MSSCRIRHIGAISVLVLLWAALVCAQPAPDRAQDVSAFINANVHRFNGTDDRRREVLFDLIRHLNVRDNGNWGALQKTDRRPPVVPADIIVWRYTREHFDVLTDSGGLWRVVGPLTNPAWIWLQVEGSNLPPLPPQAVMETLEELRSNIEQLHALLSVQAAAFHKHIADLNARLAKEEETREWRLQELGEQFMQHGQHAPHFSDCAARIPWFRIPVHCDLVP